jgi:hypothetical protein
MDYIGINGHKNQVTRTVIYYSAHMYTIQEA